MLSYLANKCPHKCFPQPAITLLRHPHLQPHNLRHCHGPPWHGLRPRTPLSHRRCRCRHHYPPRQGASQHPQPKRLLHPTCLGHRQAPPIAIACIMLRIKRDRALAAEPRWGPARREEDFIGSFPYVIMVETFKVAKRPGEVAVLVVETQPVTEYKLIS